MPCAVSSYSSLVFPNPPRAPTFQMREWSESCSVGLASLRPHRLYSLWNSPGQNTGVGSLSLLQGIFLTQGSNPGLLHCRRILYQLSHKGSPRILEWGSLSLLWGIFLTQESNRGLLHCRQFLYQLNSRRSPDRWESWGPNCGWRDWPVCRAGLCPVTCRTSVVLAQLPGLGAW